MLALRIVFTSTLILTAAGDSFLASRRGQSVTASIVEDVLLAEIHDTAKRLNLNKVQDALRTTFTALPKNAYGQLDSTTVRYALHRYFVQAFGWYVKGLEPDGFVWTENSTVIMKDRVPALIQNLMEKRMLGRGLDLAGLAVFASTLTELIEKDVTSNFEEIYEALGYQKTDTLKARDVDEVMRGYVARHLFGGTDPTPTRRHVKYILKEIRRMYAGWPATAMWLKDARIALEWNHMSFRNPFVEFQRTFATTTDTAHQIMHQFVQVANAECPALKSTLMQLEFQGTGRVLLSEFYANTQGQPRESEEYLQSLGCLDRTVPERPKLLIANYISSRANCVVDTSYYSTCCLNECEGLIAHIERSVMTPEVEPSRIADMVSNLPSSSVDAPRNLSETLLRRLNGIADKHGGQVPLHGRLFSQWMHHVYPRECPYPHRSGSTKQFSQDEWINLKKVNDVFASPEEMTEHVQRAAKFEADDSQFSAEDFAWSGEEELVAVHWRPQVFAGTNVFRLLMAGVALISLIVPLTRTFQSCSLVLESEKKVLCV